MASFLIIHNFKAVQRRVNPNQQVPKGGITRVYYIAITQSDKFLYTDLLMLYYEYIYRWSFHARSNGGEWGGYPLFWNGQFPEIYILKIKFQTNRTSPFFFLKR